SATPLEKSVVWLRTFVLPEPSPVIEPVSGELPVIVTLVAPASKPVIVLFHVSRAVKVFVPAKAVALVSVAAVLQRKLLSAPGATEVIPRLGTALIEPSVAVIVGLSTL